MSARRRPGRRPRRRLARPLAIAPVWALVTAVLLGSLGIAITQRSGVAQLLTVLSGSMQPTLPLGSLVVVVPRDADAVRVGYVITFSPPGESTRTVTHRVVDVQGSGRELRVHTRGDANPVADPWTLNFPTGRTWVVVADAPWLGRPWLWLAQPLHRELVLVPATVLVTLMWLTTVWRRDVANPVS
jgi:signal peptidase I